MVRTTDTGNILRSTDGSYWQQISVGHTNLYSVCWAEELELFCAVYNTGTTSN
jgi:hypothetical protein